MSELGLSSDSRLLGPDGQTTTSMVITNKNDEPTDALATDSLSDTKSEKGRLFEMLALLRTRRFCLIVLLYGSEHLLGKGTQMDE